MGWADDSQSLDFPLSNNSFRTFVLAVDASGMATVTVDGVMALSRSNFVGNGTIAIGDQSNEADVDSTMLLGTVTLLCP